MSRVSLDSVAPASWVAASAASASAMSMSHSSSETTGCFVTKTSLPRAGRASGPLMAAGSANDVKSSSVHDHGSAAAGASVSMP